MAVLTDRLLLNLPLVLGNVALVLLEMPVEPLGYGAAPRTVDNVLVCVHVLNVDSQPLTNVVTARVGTFFQVCFSVVDKLYMCLQFHKRFTAVRTYFLLTLHIYRFLINNPLVNQIVFVQLFIFSKTLASNFA